MYGNDTFRTAPRIQGPLHPLTKLERGAGAANLAGTTAPAHSFPQSPSARHLYLNLPVSDIRADYTTPPADRLSEAVSARPPHPQDGQERANRPLTTILISTGASWPLRENVAAGRGEEQVPRAR